MNLQYQWKRLESLTPLELYALLQARESVFVVEQQCPYQEADGMDLHAWHLSVSWNGELAACARVVDPGFKYPQPSIGRVMTLGKFRKLRIGRALVAEAIAFTEQHYPGAGIQIGAQARLEPFYRSFGFQAVGAVYDEDGIPHRDMVKPATAPGA